MAPDFFTQGIDYSLPHPPIPPRVIILLCDVIKRAWQLLKEQPPDGFTIGSANEDTITQSLIEIIENRLRKNGEVEGFNSALFGKVNREPKITNFNKSHPDKMPDIYFDLKRDRLPVLNDQDGLFVECKPVDSTHTIGSCYFQKGLMRFIIGDYGWAMQDALMVGYVKSTYTFQHLISAFNSQKSAAMKTIKHFTMDDCGIYRSIHERGYEWLENHGQACPISVSHLWLRI
jgi:hypothetical protein